MIPSVCKTFSDGVSRYAPVFYGKSWYIHWTSDGVAELLVRRFNKGTSDSAIKRMKTLFNKIGMKYVVGTVSITQRSFPPYWGGSVEAWCFELDIEQPIPLSPLYKLA